MGISFFMNEPTLMKISKGNNNPSNRQNGTPNTLRIPKGIYEFQLSIYKICADEDESDGEYYFKE